MAYSPTEENVSKYADLLKESLTAAGGSTDLKAADSVSDWATIISVLSRAAGVA